MFLVIEIDVCRCPHLFPQTNCQTRTLQGEQVLHAGRALPPLQTAITGIGFLIPASSEPCLPLQGSCRALTGHLQPPSAAPTCAASPGTAGAAPSSCCCGDTREYGEYGIHLSPSPAQQGALDCGGHEDPAGCTCCAHRKAGSSRAGRWHRLSCSAWDTPAHNSRQGRHVVVETGVCGCHRHQPQPLPAEPTLYTLGFTRCLSTLAVS